MSLLARLQDPSLLLDKAFIGGHWVSAASGETIAVTDPATGKVITLVPACGAVETRAAIAAAEAASGRWRALPAAERGRLMEVWHDLMLANVEDLAAIMTAEQGKPLAEARGEIRYGASFVKWFAEEAKPRLRRRRSRAHERPPHPRAQAAGRRLRRPSRRGTSPSR